MDRGQWVDGRAELLVGPWWYSIWWNFQRLELDGRRQAAVGIVEEAGRGEDGKLLGIGHVYGWARCI